MAGQNSDFGNIESRREEKHHLKKWWRRVNNLMFLAFSWAIIFFMFMNPEYENTQKELNLLDFLVVDFGNMGGSALNVPLYYLVGGIVMIFYWAIFMGNSKDELIDQVMEKASRKRKIGATLAIKVKLVKYLDKIFYYALFPLSYLVISIDTSSAVAKNRFYMRYGWLSHLEKNFFKQTIKSIDGYERVKELGDFKEYPLLFSNERNIDKARMSQEFKIFMSLFKSKESLEDVFLISEGYMKSSGGKYDTFLNKSEFQRVLDEDFGGKLNNFRVYDGKENIYFSFELMKRLVDVETKRFMAFLEKYSLSSSGMEFSRTYKQSFELVQGDTEILKMIKGLHYPKPIPEDAKIDKKELVRRIKFLFSVYFRFSATFYMINQYINFPAGTAVVRMDDYTLRMIIETYDNENVVSIEKRKNDGSTKSFKGDGLTNMFLLAWNFYNYSASNSFKDKAYKIFNLRDEEMEVELSGVNQGDTMSNSVQGFLNSNEPAPAFDGDDKETEDAKKFLFS